MSIAQAAYRTEIMEHFLTERRAELENPPSKALEKLCGLEAASLNVTTQSEVGALQSVNKELHSGRVSILPALAAGAKGTTQTSPKPEKISPGLLQGLNCATTTRRKIIE